MMTFTSWNFWVFFGAVFLVHAGIGQVFAHRPHRRQTIFRSALLLAMSLGFYALAAGKLVVLILASILVNHVMAWQIFSTKKGWRTMWTAIAISANTLALGVFKYAYFIADVFQMSWTWRVGNWRLDQWMLPLGISFFTFQAISYVIDVHRGTLSRPAPLLQFATYLTFFPQLVAGPIVRAGTFLPQLQAKSWGGQMARSKPHVLRLLSGMLKKLLLGDLLGAWLVDPVFAEPGHQHGAVILLALYGYSLQVYADFSGYTDMAKGMAGLLGIELPENFNFPYQARTPAEFWRRWHMTLSSWWKDYVYIPIGGNRSFSLCTISFALTLFVGFAWRWGEPGGALVLGGAGLLMASAALMWQSFSRRLATGLNVLLVMLLGGLWHGAHENFVMWGAINGLFLMAWSMTRPELNRWWKRALAWMLTFHVVVFSRIWFRAGSLLHWDETTESPHPEDAWQTAVLLWERVRHSWEYQLECSETLTWSLGLLGTGFALHFLPSSKRNLLRTACLRLPLPVLWAVWCACALLAVWCESTYSKPFIYWQF